MLWGYFWNGFALWWLPKQAFFHPFTCIVLSYLPIRGYVFLDRWLWSFANLRCSGAGLFDFWIDACNFLTLTLSLRHFSSGSTRFIFHLRLWLIRIRENIKHEDWRGLFFLSQRQWSFRSSPLYFMQTVFCKCIWLEILNISSSSSLKYTTLPWGNILLRKS